MYNSRVGSLINSPSDYRTPIATKAIQVMSITITPRNLQQVLAIGFTIALLIEVISTLFPSNLLLKRLSIYMFIRPLQTSFGQISTLGLAGWNLVSTRWWW